jgi:phage baseplate assembly protein W
MPLRITSSENDPVYSDIDPTFTKNPKNKDLLLIKDTKAIKIALQNLLSTAFGERLFQPQIGGSLRPLLFEPVDSITAFEIRDRILETIRKNEPRVSNILIDVISNPDSNDYVVNVEYTIQSVGAVDRLTTILERIR